MNDCSKFCPTIAAFATPAFAQSGDTQATGTGQQDQVMAMTAEKLKTQLSNAGFKEVTVLDAAYLVQAQTEDGNRVLMLINPPANMTDTTATTGSTTPDSDASTWAKRGGWSALFQAARAVRALAPPDKIFVCMGTGLSSACWG
ncbi:hypothetical protein SJ05684_b43080 (plasmid) [Sinorhizobium sojae CCBAU 05684]|uniref:Uncharacterized protein n=1 Tax=Sinorhizobium sojae CCBAU 05684 TaxID=716928 RepID=A0A249PH73_9HYPH|nr:hypothetical protein [Sinorhizobium sojae]ASY65290.1 hypothetical protein SJ05684_b43080 [Sinorhizobium sojae CCBAU 05684]